MHSFRGDSDAKEEPDTLSGRVLAAPAAVRWLIARSVKYSLTIARVTYNVSFERIMKFFLSPDTFFRIPSSDVDQRHHHNLDGR
jgi:hypothetical protein